MIKEFADCNVVLNDSNTYTGLSDNRFVNATLTFMDGWLEIVGRSIYGDYIHPEATVIYPARRITRVIKLADKVDLRKFHKSI